MQEIVNPMRMIDADVLIAGLKAAKRSRSMGAADPIEREALEVIFDFAIVAVEEVIVMTEKGRKENGHDRQTNPHKRNREIIIR